VVNVIGGKPVYLVYFDSEITDGSIRDIFESQRIGLLSPSVAHDTDEAGAMMLDHIREDDITVVWKLDRLE
jgi:hypothetical protein